MKFPIFLLMIAIGGVTLESCAPAPGGGGVPTNNVTPTPFNPGAPAIIRSLGRGINVGNELDAEPGSESSWTGIDIQQSWFDDYTNAGFTSVRIPVTWGYELAGNVGNPPAAGQFYPAIDATYMARVKTVVDWALSRNLYVVLNCHHENWLYPDYNAGMTNFTNIWRQIASEFASEPAGLVFEILNEPQGNMSNAQVNDMNTKVLAIIRSFAGNANRYVIIGADSYNAFNRLTDSSFSVPAGDSYLIANFHYYNPWNFCGLYTGTWGTASDKSGLAGDLLSVKNWAALHNNIPVYIGEYGAADGCDLYSRYQWYDTLSADANGDGFAYTAWDDFGNQPGSFQIFHRTAGTFDRNILNGIF